MDLVLNTRSSSIFDPIFFNQMITYPNPMDLRVTRRHKKREGKVEDIARVVYRRLSPVLLKIQFNYLYELGDQLEISRSKIQKTAFMNKASQGPAFVGSCWVAAG